MYPDDLDSYTYDLMEGICGKENMLFEVNPIEELKRALGEYDR